MTTTMLGQALKVEGEPSAIRGITLGHMVVTA
jgi:hypothetical protein